MHRLPGSVHPIACGCARNLTLARGGFDECENKLGFRFFGISIFQLRFILDLDGNAFWYALLHIAAYASKHITALVPETAGKTYHNNWPVQFHHLHLTCSASEGGSL